MAADRPSRSAAPPDPRALDLPALARTGATLQGTLPLAQMPRLAGSVLAAADAELAPAVWTAAALLRPVTGGAPELWLHLQARADVRLECQRCLQPMDQTLEVDRRFRFVRGEDEAARLDEESEDDVLALPGRLDLLELLEDELILALPLVPRHETCPQPLPAPTTAAPAAPEAGDERPHPFAALAALKRGGGSGRS
ncbi:MAG: DUF177 domain-containing protein [Rubrivivax sp.]|nr:DUF177 domain-containing protein [Rubrivivax sp.]